MGCQIRQLFSWLLLLGALVLAVLIGLGWLDSPQAAAAIRQLEEAPGQVVYQSRQTLEDQQGHRWQSIAFKRIRSDGQTSVDLRLVGFPGQVTIDRTQPLTLTNSLHQTLQAPSDDRTLFTDTANPPANVGQYDLQSVLPELPAEIPLKLTVPTLQGDAASLLVPPALIQEWQAVAQTGSKQRGEAQNRL